MMAESKFHIKEHVHFDEYISCDGKVGFVHGVAVISVQFRQDLQYPLKCYRTKKEAWLSVEEGIKKQVLEGIDVLTKGMSRQIGGWHSNKKIVCKIDVTPSNTMSYRSSGSYSSIYCCKYP